MKNMQKLFKNIVVSFMILTAICSGGYRVCRADDEHPYSTSFTDTDDQKKDAAQIEHDADVDKRKGFVPLILAVVIICITFGDDNPDNPIDDSSKGNPNDTLVNALKQALKNGFTYESKPTFWESELGDFIIKGGGKGLVLYWNPSDESAASIIIKAGPQPGEVDGSSTGGGGMGGFSFAQDAGTFAGQLIDFIKGHGKNNGPKSGGSGGDTQTHIWAVNMGLLGGTDGYDLLLHPKANPGLIYISVTVKSLK